MQLEIGTEHSFNHDRESIQDSISPDRFSIWNRSGPHLALLAIGLALAAAAALLLAPERAGQGARQSAAGLPHGSGPVSSPAFRSDSTASATSDRVVVFYLVESEERAERIRGSEFTASQEASSTGAATVTDRQVAVLVLDSPEAATKAQWTVGATYADAALSGMFSVEVHDLRAP